MNVDLNAVVARIPKEHKEDFEKHVVGFAAVFPKKEDQDKKIWHFRFMDITVRATCDGDGEPWLIARDACEALGIQNVAIDRFGLEDDEIRKMYIPDLSNTYTLVNESGLYTLIVRSNKPSAKKFRKWVTSEVLPSIRKTGRYEAVPHNGVVIDPTKNDPGTLRYLSQLMLQSAEQAERIKSLEPKAEMFDTFMSGENLKSIGTVAKVLGTGQNRMFKMLREVGFLRKDNLPFQEFLDRGYAVVKETPIKIKDTLVNYPKTLVTPKGEAYIANIMKRASRRK